MSQSDSPTDLQTSQDLRFQQREWVVQRIGWVVMCLVVIAALAGLMGRGPASTARAAADSGRLSADYERFGRSESSNELRVTVDRAFFENGAMRLRLDADLLRSQRVESILPEPRSVQASEDGYTYTFAVSEEAARAEATFHLLPLTAGRHNGRLGVPGGPSIAIRQFIYP